MRVSSLFEMSPDHAARLTEAEQRAFLSRPIPDAIAHPEHLTRPTRCKVLRPFCIEGKPVAPNAIVTLLRHDADSLASSGRVEIIE